MVAHGGFRELGVQRLHLALGLGPQVVAHAITAQLKRLLAADTLAVRLGRLLFVKHVHLALQNQKLLLRLQLLFQEHDVIAAVGLLAVQNVLQ